MLVPGVNLLALELLCGIGRISLFNRVRTGEFFGDLERLVCDYSGDGL